MLARAQQRVGASRSAPSSKSRRRAIEACSFCRRRKIKCNGARPVCVNCQSYSQSCIYEPVGEAAKETGRRRHRFKTRTSPNTSEDATSSPWRASATESAPVDGEHASGSNEAGASSVEAGVARILMSADGVSTYHSRTSTLYEDHAPEKQAEVDTGPRIPDAWVEKGLVAEAAKQRQLEDLNFRQQRLDFDGVDPDLGMHLLSIHWNRQHHSFLVTYRPAFMRDMACGGPYFSKLLLNAIYFGASKFSPRLEVRKDANDVRTAGWKFRERVRELLGGSLDSSRITTIQALLQMTNSLFALGDERSAAWLYSGMAFRMIIDLGMHVDLTKTGRFSDEDLEIRRRVFWGAFVIDKMQSLYQGRPVSLKDTDVLVPIKFLDTHEELEDWQPFAYSTLTPKYSGSPAYSVSTFSALCRLSLVMSDILSCIYTERCVDQSPTDLASMLDRLQVKLDDWKAALPSHVQMNLLDPEGAGAFPPPHVFSLHAMHNVLVILLHRPFVADGHLYNTSRSILVDSFMKCATAASNIADILLAYDRAFSIRHAPYLISYATYVAATILVRIAAKRRSESKVFADLATCLAVFKENQETNYAVQKAAIVIETLIKRLGVVVDLAMAHPSPMASQEQRLQAGGNASPSAYSSNMTSVNANEVMHHSNSEWLDIDGIIQSFLEDGNSSVPKPAMAYSTERSRCDHCRMALANNHEHRDYPADVAHVSGISRLGEDVYSVESQWSTGVREREAQLDGLASINDPLFGFNGSIFANGGSLF
ncbi:C6 transcription factor [Trichoderma asperelloides]|nr:C6 transcription factor [Trichoderma asperelloides]